MYNFKSVEYAEHIFSTGLNLVKGRNESGKSTRFHAIAYALFGARALPLPLAETVTYDKPESSLKVVLEFDYNDKSYKVQRSKSGAVLTCGEVTANGQAEVTKFVESLLFVNADTASKLMIASQKGLSGALEGNAAIPLIEKLANIDMIDGLITKVQEQLPCGSTKPFIATIEGLEEVPVPTVDFKAIEPEVERAKIIVDNIKFNILNAETNINSLKVEEAKDVLARAMQQSLNKERLETELATLNKVLAIPPKQFDGDINALRVKYSAQKAYKEREEAYKKFLNQPAEVSYYEKGATLNSDIADTKEAIKHTEIAISDLRVEIAKAQSMRIDDESCALCGKMLQDVLEVVLKNETVESKVSQLEVEKARLELTLAQQSGSLHLLNDYYKANQEAEKLYASISKYVTVEYTLPIKMHWVGDIPTQADLTDYATAIREAEAAKDLAITELAKWDSLYDRKQTVISALNLLDVIYRTDEAQEVLDTHAKLTQQLEDFLNKLHHAEMVLQQTEYKLTTAKLEYAHEEETYNQAQLGIAKAQEAMLVYEKHNSLIKKLREARPIVAARLWSIVLATVSTYFSQIRGFRSVVTRSVDSFLVNGKPVGGVSGSTFDSLGLAMRMALSKTFLPMVDFILLDEPASGMDDERETAMLGLLSVASYSQILLVTHSNLADSFAGSVVQL